MAFDRRPDAERRADELRRGQYRGPLHGMPLAIQLVGRPWGEADLLRVAARCEARLALPPREPRR